MANRTKKFRLFLLAIVGMLVIAFALFQWAKSNHSKPKNIYESMKQKSFLTVNSHFNNKPEWNMSLDLQGERAFGNLVAVDHKLFYGLSKENSKDEIYETYEKNYLSIFKHLTVSNKEIEDEKFVVEKEVIVLLDKKELEKEFPSDFESSYLSPSLQLRKIRIDFNKDFLPIKVEGYYEGTEPQSWEVLRTISYPFKNKRAFNSELADYIDLIKDIQEEQEAEWEIENGG